MSRLLALLYGILCYLIFFATFLYAIAFVGGLGVPVSLDSDPSVAFGEALLVDAILLGVFAVQHSVMARPAFKRWWTRIVPAVVERSTYVLFSSLALILLFWQWRPLGGMVWQVESPVARDVLRALFVLGWATVLIGTFLISHFDLFGLRQVWLNWHRTPYTPPGFVTPFFYRVVRHPIMLGFIIAFWATPRMTLAHLVFAIATTAYILVALQFEEHDLAASLGEPYRDYQRRVRMLVPLPRKA
ncbi:MAG: isoprenylcysteine carboxylmethyltransferase family protein [Xanthomonadales bacterium PRO7]|nr:isoprenylcysteine carboxylmethyltransferase family protein [Xanthomonadales bacterium PRO7]